MRKSRKLRRGQVLSMIQWLTLGVAVLASAYVSAAPYAYVIASGVQVIDTDTETVVGTIVTAGAPTQVETSADGTRVYISSSAGGTVTVVDAVTNNILATWTVGAGAAAMGLTPDGTRLYVVVGASLRALDTATGAELANIALPSSAGAVVVSSDGTRAFATASGIQVVDTATNTIATAVTEGAYPAGPAVISGNRLYYTHAGDIFGGGTGVTVFDTQNLQTVASIGIGSITGQMALTPDGSRLYVGMQAHWVDTGYGAGFFNDRTVAVIDTNSNTWVAVIDLGADGSNWSQQNSPSGIAVAADRSDVYIGVPRLSSVAVAAVNTNVVRQRIPVGSSPGLLRTTKDPNAVLVPYTVVANDDAAAFPIPTSGATAVANVLANDRLGGVGANLSNVTLSLVSTTSAGLVLDLASGSVTVAANADIGLQSLVYRICEIGNESNCDDAAVNVEVRLPYVIDAVDDSATTKPGTQPLNVLVNDTLNALPATTGNVTLSVVSSTSPSIQLHTGTGQIFVYVQTTGGNHSLVYRICEKQVPANCDTATVNLNITPLVVDAVNDAGSVSRSGGVAVANVLTNDKIDGLAATTARVRLSQVSSTHAGISLNITSGAVMAVAGIPLGNHSLTYRICEIVVPSNCDDATVTITTTPYLIDAVNDYGKGASKRANLVIPSVLTNDRLGGTTVSNANVILTRISLTPANSKIVLNTTTGAVNVTGKTSSGIYSLVYQICERANPTNCDRATATVELSGGL